ncbi:amylo-alpha-1,6-glucosidase [Roseomonas elaeocarpi]|uniref:Glycogen debranching N-terminal domain-containing protein n=1 Tax=Roseomonas elaeocarpi TaxID=907779 RepID=A0ABV6JM37_9PROT
MHDEVSPASASPSGGRSSEGPGATRTTGRVAAALTRLRDANRCTVRPDNLIAYQGFAVLITDRQARLREGSHGFFLHQTRFLSRLELEVDGKPPSPISANTVEAHSLLAYHLAPSPAGLAASPDRDNPNASPGEVVSKGIALQLHAFVGGGLHLDLIVTNHALAETEVTLGLVLDADFADIEEVQAGERQQRGTVERHWAPRPNSGGGEPGGALTLRYGHPGLDLATTVALAGGDGWSEAGERLECRLRLRPQEPRLITLDLSPRMAGTETAPFYGVDGGFAPEATPAAARRDWADGCAVLEAGDPAVQATWDRAVSDLASLQTGEGTEGQPWMVVAGIPNFSGLFGRDAFVAALQSAVLNPATLRGALDAVTPWNAQNTDDFLDAEPGKVLHQRLRGPLATLGLTPFGRYYGDHTAPGLFLLAAARHFTQTGDAALLRSQRPALERTLDWMAANRDASGFHFYRTRSPKGLKNQSWKDSEQAVLYPDGRNVAAPIAMADVQAIFFGAQRSLGEAFATLGEAALSERLHGEAAALRERFNERYWMPGERYFAIALDGAGQQVRSIASDPGSCLAYGIVDENKAAAVADRLLAPDMFSGWGIRTLSSEHPAFNPFAYHLGTVWPAPNAIAAFGLRRYGFDDHAHRVVRALFDAAQIFDEDRLPEVFGGHPRDARHPHPGLYPGACSPQAWSASAVVLMVDTLLGLLPMAPRGTLVVDPALPAWLPEVTLRDVRVGSARASLRFRRDGSGRTGVQVLEHGGLRILRLEDLPPGQDRVSARTRAALGHPGATVLAGG